MTKKKTNSATHMSDIARKAGVSLATVSRTFNPATAHLVTDKTRERILRIARAQNYTPNRLASALSSGTTKTIGLIFPPTTHFSESTFDISILTSSVAQLHEHGYDLKVHFLTPDNTDVYPAQLAAQLAVDGLILAGIPAHYTLHSSPGFSGNIVLLSTYSAHSYPHIDADNLSAGHAAARCFIQHGHTALAIIAGPRDSQNAIDRTTGFIKEATAAGISIQRKWRIHCDYGYEDGTRAAQKLFKPSSHPTAVFCVSDEIALGTLAVLRHMSLNCPKDVSLIGFDNAPTTAHTTPPLTTFAQPFDEMVSAAVTSVLKQSGERNTDALSAFPVSLIERESVAHIRQ